MSLWTTESRRPHMREAEDGNHALVKSCVSKSSQETPLGEPRSAGWGSEDIGHRFASGGGHKAVKYRLRNNPIASGKNETCADMC